MNAKEIIKFIDGKIGEFEEAIMHINDTIVARPIDSNRLVAKRVGYLAAMEALEEVKAACSATTTK